MLLLALQICILSVIVLGHCSKFLRVCEYNLSCCVTYSVSFSANCYVSVYVFAKILNLVLKLCSSFEVPSSGFVKIRLIVSSAVSVGCKYKFNNFMLYLERACVD